MVDGSPVSDVATDAVSSFATRLQRLFTTCVEPTSGRPWRNSEIVRRCSTLGHELSESHLSELRRGIKNNPTVHTVSGLAKAFGVPLGYFTDSHVFATVDARLTDRLAVLQEEREDRDRAESASIAAAQRVGAALTATRLGRLPRSGRTERTTAMRDAAALLNEQGTGPYLTATDFRRRTDALMRVTALLGVDQPSQLS